MRRSSWAVIALALLAGACGARELDLEFPAGLSWRARRTIARIAEGTVREARRLLPGLAPRPVLKVRTGTEVIPETGESATAIAPRTLYWTVDPRRPGGVAGVARRQLRATLLHELHHLVRDARVPRRSLMDEVIAEGLATAFERDVGGACPPWGAYPPEAPAWLRELVALPATAERRPWMFRHPDGRRWIGFKVGTYVADRARAATGRTAAELVGAPTAELVRLALSR